MVKLTVSVRRSDYRSFGRRCPQMTPKTITAMADSGAQSCLWSMNYFLAAGYSQDDLISVSMGLVTANKSPIKVDEAIVVHPINSRNHMQLWFM